MIGRSLSTRLFYTYAAIILVILISVSIGLSYLIHGYFYETRRGELIRYATEIANSIDEYSGNRINRGYVYDKLEGMDAILKARILVIDNNMDVVYVSQSDTRGVPRNDYEPKEVEPKDVLMKKNDERMRIASEQVRKPSEKFIKLLEPIFINGESVNREFVHPIYNERVLLIGVPIRDGDAVIGTVLVSSAVSNISDFMHEVYWYIGMVIFGALILSLFLVHYFARNTVAPLVAMQRSAAAMVQGDYTQRVEVKGEDEVADLGRSLNYLSKDLKDFVEKMHTYERIRRDFVANVSHELRTPLTIIRGYNQAIADGTIQDKDKIAIYQNIINDEVNRLERLINDLLELSRTQSGREMANERIPLDELVRDVLIKLQIKASEKNIELYTDIEAAHIFGNGDRLVQLVLILVDNAIKYTGRGGRVGVLLKNRADYIDLIVEDTGRGIPEDDLHFIWERFYKVDKSHSRQEGGTGLGLAIAREIMTLHKADVSLESSLDKGTKIVVSFPKV